MKKTEPERLGVQLTAEVQGSGPVLEKKLDFTVKVWERTVPHSFLPGQIFQKPEANRSVLSTVTLQHEILSGSLRDQATPGGWAQC